MIIQEGQVAHSLFMSQSQFDCDPGTSLNQNTPDVQEQYETVEKSSSDRSMCRRLSHKLIGVTGCLALI